MIISPILIGEKLGEVTKVGYHTSGRPEIQIRWHNTCQMQAYALKGKGRIIVKCTDPGNGWYYYPEHLPVVGNKINLMCITAVKWYCTSPT